MTYRLFDMAEVIRSKNSGPFELTFDIIFKDLQHFEAFVQNNAITKEVFAGLYNIPLDDVLSTVSFPPAKAFKITIKRPMASGDLGEKDIYGAQQHTPLLGFEYEI